MILSDQQIEQFKTIYLRQHGEEIADEDAREVASQLVNFVDIIIKKTYVDNKERKAPE